MQLMRFFNGDHVRLNGSPASDWLVPTREQSLAAKRISYCLGHMTGTRKVDGTSPPLPPGVATIRSV